MRVEPFQDQNRLKLPSKRSSKMDPEFIKKSFENEWKIAQKSTKIERRGVPGALWVGPKAPRSIFYGFGVPTWVQVEAKLTSKSDP